MTTSTLHDSLNDWFISMQIQANRINDDDHNSEPLELWDEFMTVVEEHFELHFTAAVTLRATWMNGQYNQDPLAEHEMNDVLHDLELQCLIEDGGIFWHTIEDIKKATLQAFLEEYPSGHEKFIRIFEELI